MARLSAGLNSVPPSDGPQLEPRRSNLEPVVNPERYEGKCENAPFQPHGKSRVWGFNSFARLPASGGEFSPRATLQIGHRTPRPKVFDVALNSVLRAAVVHRDAVATVPGASSEGEVTYSRPGGASTSGPRALKNAALLC